MYRYVLYACVLLSLGGVPAMGAQPRPPAAAKLGEQPGYEQVVLVGAPLPQQREDQLLLAFVVDAQKVEHVVEHVRHEGHARCVGGVDLEDQTGGDPERSP